MGSVISKILDEERECPPLFKPVNKESVIKWQTGKPKEFGLYIVTLNDNSVATDEWYKFSDVDDWHYFWNKVIAWCKLSDITPYNYKEETK